MFNENNRIIIVDDEESQLLELAKVFLFNGVSCKTILYNQTYDKPLNGVRIAFFDISLTGKVIDLAQSEFNYETDRNLSSVFNDLAIAIQNCISIDNGPFALIFWSKHAKAFPNFIKFVNERGFDIPSPILIGSMDKSNLIGRDPEEFQNIINSIFEGKSIKLLFDFESKCEKAAIDTVNNIFKIIPVKAPEEEKHWANTQGFEDNFDLIFSNIANATMGYEHANISPDRAVLEALLPIMNYRLLSNSILETDWKVHLKSIRNRNSEYPDNFNKGILNSIFHIDTISEVTFDKRGSVFEYNYEIPFSESYLINLVPYFEKLEEITNINFAKFITFKDEITSEFKDKIRGQSKFIAIEISASCDFSQNKARNHKYVLGLITPKIDPSNLDENKISKSVFYKELPVFYINNIESQIWINFNYVLSNFNPDKNLGKPQFILKKEIIDLIGNRYANHVSRIGITSF